MATIAVFLVLGGGAIAAITLPANSVGTKQLKRNAVKAKKIAKNAVTNPKIADNAVGSPEVRDGTLTAADLAGGQFFRRVVVRETVVPNIGNNVFQTETINCAPGEEAVGGGGIFTALGSRNIGATDIETSPRTVTPVDANGNAPAEGDTPVGYYVALQNVSGASRDYHGYVICAQR